MNVYYVAGVPYSDELYHYGIRFQKWGVRRFQNPDGSYTPAGKERYAKLKSDLSKFNEKRNYTHKEYTDSLNARDRFRGDKINAWYAKKRADESKEQKDVNDYVKKREKLNESRKEYKRIGKKKEVKKRELNYLQAEWKYKKTANKINKLMGKANKYEISTLSPKAQKRGKKALGALLAAGGVASIGSLGIGAIELYYEWLEY